MRRNILWLLSVAVLLTVLPANIFATPEGEADRSSSLCWIRWVRWHPQGQWILFVRQGKDANEMRIYKVRPDGTELTVLSPANSGDFSPVWSANGQRIAFITSSGGTPAVYTMNADGTGAAPVPGPHPGVLELVRWLPDGRLVFIARRGDGPLMLGTMDAVSGMEERFWCTAGEADWHPSGNYVVDSHMERTPEGGVCAHLYEVDLGTRQTRIVTSGENVLDSNPRYSSDGEWIVFVSPGRSPTDSSIWLVRRDGTGIYCLPLADSVDTEESDADFSPDGQYLAFARGEYAPTDLYICRVDGTGLRKLTNFYPDGQAKGQSTLKVAKAPIAPKANAKPVGPVKPAQPAKPAKKEKKREKKGAPFPLLAPPIPLRRH